MCDADVVVVQHSDCIQYQSHSAQTEGREQQQKHNISNRGDDERKGFTKQLHRQVTIREKKEKKEKGCLSFAYVTREMRIQT